MAEHAHVFETGLRRLLVPIDGSAHSRAAATLATAWGQRFGAELLGLGVLDEPGITKPEPVPLGATSFKRERDDMRLADAQERIDGFLEVFRDDCQAAKVRCVTLRAVGVPHEQIILEATGCDAVVLGTETNFHFETQQTPDGTLSHVLRQSPRPVVVVPQNPAQGDGALIAYGCGQESGHALQTFTLLGLADDERLTVLSIDVNAAQAAQRLRRAGDFLVVHGFSPRLVPIVSDAEPAGLILQEIEHRRPRILVMGAHGHHPVKDLFVTSVTRALLKESPIPVFIGG
jgi:nucleotide-binding universal stress UspA family protein